MKLTVLAAVAALCVGCKGPSAAHPAPPAAAARYAATRWLPAQPSYALAAPTVRDAQRTLHEVIEVFGMPLGLEVHDVGKELAEVLAVDPLDADAVAGIGVDLDGGFALFSEEVTPTFVVHLSAPAQMQAFIDQQRQRGLVTQSVVVDGAEVFSAAIGGGASLSWAIADDWLWLHLTPPFARAEGTAWFEHSHHPAAPAWAGTWQWAEGAAKLAQPSVVGYVDAARMLATLVAHAPDAARCASLVAPVQRVALAAETDGHAAQLRVALDVGASARSLAAAQLPVPEGFTAVAAGAPLAVQWNLDLGAVADWLAPCVASFGGRFDLVDRYGVRAGRAALLQLDADAKKAAGVVALDLAHAKFLRGHLDDIPLRSTLERSRTYGPYAGHALSIPFVASVDYVLTDKLALAGMGDGLLAKLVGSGATVPGPLAAVDVIPGALSAESWRTVLEAIGLHRTSRIVDRMMAWKDGHLRLEVEGGALVFTAAGTRR
jgi:hypothetical protein